MSKVLQLCGASVIIYKQNKVLLQQRKDNGCWAYHGGRIEIGEIVEVAAKRELFEETGLTALSLELFGVFSGPELNHTYPDGNKVSIIDIVFLCDNFEGELIPQQSEVTNLKWFDINNIPENLSPPTKPAFKKFVEQYSVD